MAGYLFEYASAAKSPARVSCLVLQLLVRFGVSKQLFALSKMMTDAPTDIDGVFAFKRQNFAKERFYSVVHSQPPVWPPGLERAPGKADADVILADDSAPLAALTNIKGLKCGCEKDVVRFSDHGEINTPNPIISPFGIRISFSRFGSRVHAGAVFLGIGNVFDERSRSASFAILAAIRRASSLVSNLAADRYQWQRNKPLKSQ
jgi:hypothetical protein